MRFGEYLAKQLDEADIDQAEYAEAVGIRPSTISLYINSTKPPKRGVETKLGRALGLSGDALAKFEEMARIERFYFKKDVGPLFFKAVKQAAEVEDALLSLEPALQRFESLPQLGFKIPQSLKDLLLAIKKRRQ